MTPMPVSRTGLGLLTSRLAVSMILSAVPMAAFASDLKVGVRVGYYTQVDKPFVGAELLARVAHQVYFNPNIEYAFVDHGSYLTFNGDFHYDFHTHSPNYVWLGGGLGVVRNDPGAPFNAKTNLAANLLGGVGWRAGSVIPYLQAKAIITENSLFSVGFGLRF